MYTFKSRYIGRSGYHNTGPVYLGISRPYLICLMFSFWKLLIFVYLLTFTSLNCDSFYLKKNPHIPITRYYKSNRTIKVLLAQEIN